jgi:hypothetical protein
MKKRLVLCSKHRRFGHKTFYLCATEKEALEVAEHCKRDYINVEIVSVPDTLQM